MGSGRWDTSTYDAGVRHRAATGTPTFAYSATTTATKPRDRWEAHPSLNPKGIKDSPLGVRESRDSTEHPTSRAVTVFLDVTGSNIEQATIAHKKLPDLMGTVLRKGALEHPQFMFGGIGDATCDTVPFQIGQWESDNRIDATLENLLLESGGGGQKTESYELALYAMARKTAMDCWEKRGEKGYLFIIGDEMAYSEVKKHEVEAIFGDTLEAGIPTAQIAKEVQERFHAYFIIPTQSSHGRDPSIGKYWRTLFGQNVLEIQSTEDICEMIAATIAAHEGLDWEDVLKDMGASAATTASVGSALAKAGVAAGAGSGALVRPEGGVLTAAGDRSGKRL